MRTTKEWLEVAGGLYNGEMSIYPVIDDLELLEEQISALKSAIRFRVSDSVYKTILLEVGLNE